MMTLMRKFKVVQVKKLQELLQGRQHTLLTDTLELLTLMNNGFTSTNHFIIEFLLLFSPLFVIKKNVVDSTNQAGFFFF